MGTKRPFDEDLQEFIKHPKHIDYANKLTMFGENKFPLETSQNVEIGGGGGAIIFHRGDAFEGENVINISDPVHKEFETSAPFPLVTGVSGGEDDAGPGPVFCSNLFPDFFDFNLPRRQLVRYDDAYSSLLNCSPRKEIPIGPDHQADVPEFESEVARNCGFVGVCVMPMPNSDFSIEEREATDAQTDCKCMDGGSVGCVQQHVNVNEARLKLRESLGHEKFGNLGFYDMGEEVACKWTEEEEQLYHEVVYSNPISHGKRFWEQLSIAFPSRTKKELVSYYFNVFILRRRAVQNRSKWLEIDSDDDEWRGDDRRSYGVTLEDKDFVIGSFVDHGDQDSSSEDGGDTIPEDKVACVSNEQEKPVIVNKDANNDGLRPEYDFQPSDGKVWDSPYTSTYPRKGVDLLPTCSMIEEIFGSSKNNENTIQ